ncbi:MAG: class I SAM-dependent methyltransferase [Brevundimonas sp.]|nr:MAG: class I SAM-dependent methyltransferase [Brevundimonas sp.]
MSKTKKESAAPSRSAADNNAETPVIDLGRGPLSAETLAVLIALRETNREAYECHIVALKSRNRWRDVLPLLALDAPDSLAGMEVFVTALQKLGIPGNLDELSLLRLYHSGHIRLPASTQASLGDKVDLQEQSVQLAILKTLFAFEMSRGTFFHLPTKNTATFFLRGKTDVLRAARSGKPMIDADSPRYREARTHMDAVLPDSIFVDGPPKKVCEIGAAWGGSTLSITDRFAPDEFYNFEIDPDLAHQMEIELGLKSLPCDGETLTGVADASMDLVFSSGVFYFVPPIKLVSYFNEMIRVCRPGGLVYFNLLTAELLSPRRLGVMIKDPGLRRVFAPIPRSWVDEMFAEFERLPIPEGTTFNPDGEFIFRKPKA